MVATVVLVAHHEQVAKSPSNHSTDFAALAHPRRTHRDEGALNLRNFPCVAIYFSSRALRSVLEDEFVLVHVELPSCNAFT